MKSNHTQRAAVLRGIGSALPEHIVTNDDFAASLDTSDEWIVQRTGIRERRMISADEATSDLAVAAAERALKVAQLTDVDLLILATTSPDYPCPATAPAVASRLGLSTRVGAFDLGAACAGFLYALTVASSMITAGVIESALIIGADSMSTRVDQDDRATAIIFGDGAGAVVLTAGDAEEYGAVGASQLGSDGNFASAIQIPTGGSRRRINGEDVNAKPYVQMSGREVFYHAIEKMMDATERTLTAQAWSLEDVDWLVAHQANVRIINNLSKLLGIDRTKCLVNIDRVGNTSAASIPLLLDEEYRAGRFRGGDKLLLTAFGGGFAWGAIAMTWPSELAADNAAQPTHERSHA